MYCPQCGQQQPVSGDTRFCSRCGFQLTAINELLASGGVPSSAMIEQTKAGRVASPRRKGAQTGGKLLLFGVFLIPILAILQELLGINVDLPLLGVVVLMCGILRLLFALFFQEGAVRQPKRAASPSYVAPGQPYQQMNAGAPRGSALPPSQSIPVPTFMRPRDTGELTPPSITENTTRLLDEHKKQQG